MVRIKHRYITAELLSTAAASVSLERLGIADISSVLKVRL